MQRRDGNRQPLAVSASRDPDWDRDTLPFFEGAQVLAIHRAVNAESDPSAGEATEEEKTGVVERSSREAPLSIRPPLKEDHTAEWYVRLRLREDRVARLWLEGHTRHDVLVWRDDAESWAPLLTVPQLRNAIHVQRALSEPPPRVPETVRHEVAESAANPERATPSSCAPVVVDSGPVVIPGAPRVPDFAAFLISGSAATTAPELPPPGTVPGTKRITTRPPPPSARVGTTTARMPIATAPPVVGPRPTTARLIAPVPVARAARPQRVTLATLLGGDARLAQTERLAWMAAVVAVSSFAVVTVVMHKRDAARVTALAELRAIAALATIPAVAANAPSEAPASEASTRTEPAPSTDSSTDAKTAETTAGAKTVGAKATGVDAKVDGQEGPKSKDDTPAARTVRGRPRGVAGAVAATPPPTAVTAAPRPPTEDSVAPATGGSAFDKAAARNAAISAAQRVRYCTEGKASGTVVITFAPSGLVSNASILSLKGDDIRQDCVLRSFQAARVNPFVGPPVTVQKSFSVK
ncbi:MAG: hypothetical protein JW751_16765 [Polyangiaceae bacterium]|nr:hypothetical protein [Polyangiaceae bacterium]